MKLMIEVSEENAISILKCDFDTVWQALYTKYEILKDHAAAKRGAGLRVEEEVKKLQKEADRVFFLANKLEELADGLQDQEYLVLVRP